MDRFMNWLAIFLFFISLLNANASEVKIETAHTSDEIYSRGIYGEYNKSEQGWRFSYLGKESEFRREVGNNKSSVQKAQVGYKWSITQTDTLSLYAGGVFLKKSGARKNTLAGRLNYQKVLNNWSFSINTEKSSLAEDLRNTSIAGAFFTDFRTKLGANYRISEKWKSGASVAHSSMSDDNSAVLYDGNLMYGISPSWPWIWFGYGFEGITYKKNSIGYWSPRKFFTHGPRLDTSFSLFSKFSAILALNLNYHKEDGTSGSGYLGAAGIQWGQYDGNNVRLVYTKIRSGQKKSPWVYEGFQLTCNILGF